MSSLGGQTLKKSLGTKGTLHAQPTLQNNEPVPKDLKQVVHLSRNTKRNIFFQRSRIGLGPFCESHFVINIGKISYLKA